MSPRYVIYASLAAFVLLFVGVLFLIKPGTTEGFDVQGRTMQVRIARTTPQQIQGLSGIELDEFDVDGMLFVYDEGEPRTFWMKGMKFDLDIIWLNDNKVVRIHRDVKAPQKGEDPIRVSSDPLDVDAVLEVPAGDAEKWGFQEGLVVPGLAD